MPHNTVEQEKIVHNILSVSEKYLVVELALCKVHKVFSKQYLQAHLVALFAHANHHAEFFSSLFYSSSGHKAKA
jgi:hypothetical protein